FSYSVSHDLRAPVRHIDGFSKLLLDGYGSQLPPAGKNLLEKVCSAGQRLGQLIDDLLSFSRLSRQPLVKRTVSLSNLVPQTPEDFEGDRAGRNVEIRAENLSNCSGDPSLLRQVFTNLIGNALKFSRKREHPIIEISCQDRDGEVHCHVRDNGVGFDMKYA